MDVSVSEKTEKLLLNLVSTGAYATPAEALEAAVNLLHHHQLPRFTQEEFDAALEEGLAQARAGLVVPLDGDRLKSLYRKRLGISD